MEIKLFNFWYFFWLIVVIGAYFGLYYFLKNKTVKTQKTVLFSILVFALILHFLKSFIPPYSTDYDRLLRDSWFINICGANIFLFPFMFISKSKALKDYMFYLGVLGGFLACVLPLEPIQKADQSKEILDVIRFYIHHGILFIVPLLTVTLKLHTLSYKRVYKSPIIFLGVLLFIMLNQIFQSELGFVPLRGDDIFEIGYKNSSYIWGPSDDIGYFFANFCPDFFKKIPVGKYAGQVKYWPWFWMIFPIFILLLPVMFIMCLIFDFNNFKQDLITFNENIKNRRKKL